MRNDLLSYVMESVTEQGDKKDILRLMAATARELEK